MRRDDSIPVFAALNFVFSAAAVCVLVLLGIAVYTDFTDPGVTPADREGLVAGVVLLGVPSLVAAGVFAGAGVGLLRRSWWGYCAHLMGAGAAALSGIGIIYALIAIRYAARDSFRDAFFLPAGAPGFAPVVVQAAGPG